MLARTSLLSIAYSVIKMAKTWLVSISCAFWIGTPASVPGAQ